MNLFDMCILGVIAFFALKGLARGLVNEVASLAGLVAGSWLAYRYHPFLAGPLSSRFHLPVHVSSFLVFMLILILVGMAAHVLGNVITAALRVVMLGTLNRLGGLLIGSLEGILITSLLLSLGTSAFMPVQVKQKIAGSKTGAALAQVGDSLLAAWRSRSGALK